MEEEERNYCCLALLLLRVGNPCLRRYFIDQWNGAGKYTPWTDCAQNGADLLRMFKPLPYEKDAVKSGDTSRWDMSLLVKALLHSRPPFVVAADPEAAELETLRKMRNNLCHSPIPRVEDIDFQTSWKDGCNALSLFGATAGDFDKVEQDVHKPWSELLPMLKHCADQDKAILDTLDSFNSKLKQLQQGQVSIAERQAKLLQGQKNSAESQAKLLQGQKNSAESQAKLLQGQKNSAEGQAKLLQGQKNSAEGQAKLLQGQKNSAESQTKLLQGQKNSAESQTKLLQGQKNSAESQVKLLQGQKNSAESQAKLLQGQDTMLEDLSSIKQDQRRMIESHAKGDSTGEKDLSSRAQEYTEKLKSSIKQQTDFLLSEEEDKKIRTDDIFTSVTIQRGPKHFEEPKKKRFRRRQSDEIQASSKKLANCSEMFLCPENDDQQSTASCTTNPKSILLTGKAGIGKSLFCRKLVRDWSHNRLFEEGQENAKVPDFQFVFLLTFRQLLLLEKEEEKVDLCDILNRSSLLNEHSVIDEPLLQYMIDNPEKLLIVLDGYDEYKHREKITSDFETACSKDPHKKIPVPALIARIMKGKMLNGAVVLISSRPGEAEELKKIAFDVRCDIQGFSSLQVLEYIEKYFKENESMKNKALDHIRTNEILLSFGHIPVMCYLMCYCIKWYMTESKTTEKLPVTRTELYYQVIILFIKKHSSSKYEEMEETKVQEILHKLAELAVNLMMEDKYFFNEKDMKKFNLNDEEIANLKASGLLDCCPGVKKSPSKKPPLEFTFTHLTIQEFLCAFLFVKKKQIPEKEKTSDVTFMFMAGMFSREKDEQMMKKLIENIKPGDENDERNKLLTLSCLYEYKDDGFSTRVINNLKHIYCNRGNGNGFNEITDIDCLYISYLLDIVNLINAEQTKQHSIFKQSFIVKSLYIGNSSLSSSGIRMLCNSLVNISTFDSLSLVTCKLDDECFKIICDMLPRTNITYLNLGVNNITDVGAQCLCSVLIRGDCRVEVLYLHDNNNITRECKLSLEQQQIPGVELFI